MVLIQENEDNEINNFFIDKYFLSLFNLSQVIIESSYLLTKPDRSRGRKDWIIFSEMLEPIGRNALEAAEKKDAESLFQIGADLYQACVACHNVYMPK